MACLRHACGGGNAQGSITEGHTCPVAGEKSWRACKPTPVCSDVYFFIEWHFAGMRVVAVARRKEKLEALQVHMHNLRIPPTHFLPVVCDITKDAE
eukprot:scaffold219297_cov22-Tisochrysis_lutea.AAC.1